MRDIRIQNLAEEDLLEIWLYTFEQWNEVQVDDYLDSLLSDRKQH